MITNYFPFIKSSFFREGPIVAFVWKNDLIWSVETLSSNIYDNFGYKESDFLDSIITYSNIIHPDDLQTVQNEVKEAVKNKTKSFRHNPYRIKNVYGEYRWIEDYTALIFDKNGNITHFVGYIIDITNEKNSLLQIQKNEQRLKTAQSLAHIGNWELNIKTGELYWSDEIFNLFEIDKNNFTPSYEAFLNVIHPDDREAVNEAYINSIKTKEKYNIEHRLLMNDGKVKYVQEQCETFFDKNGTPVSSIGTVQDLSELKKTQMQLEKQEKELKKTISFLQSHQLAMDESSIVSKSDLKGNITYANDNFCKISGYEKNEVIGKPHNILRHPSTPKKVFKDLWKTIKSKKTWKGILKNKGKFADYWIDITILPILDENNEIVEFIAVRHDITTMMKQKQELENIANVDSLTGLGNRYKLINDINYSKQPAIAVINIDNFSLINDFYGHHTGDTVIIKFGNLMANLIRNEKYNLYHLKGDEYVIFHPDIDKDVFLEKIHLIKKQLNDITINVNEEDLNLNFSVGISFEEKTKILSSADMALKVARRNNSNMEIYSEEISLNKEYENNIKWAKKIKHAIQNDKIVPVFQPIVDNRTGAWDKYECLVRLEDDDKLISPYFFLDISKKTKHYNMITKIMIKKSFDRFKNAPYDFSINLTVEDILNEEIKEFIFSMLEEYKIGSRVIFEIVESESIENFSKIESFIKNVKKHNCKIAIDDFGTGYSNFEYLMKLKADIVKIDGSMIKELDTNEDAQVVVATIVQFAHKTGMRTVAEFVENESILNKVKELGIGFSQGYYFSAPKKEII